MRGFARSLATLAVAGILPASAIVAAQQPAQKAEAPPPAPVPAEVQAPQQPAQKAEAPPPAPAEVQKFAVPFLKFPPAPMGGPVPGAHPPGDLPKAVEPAKVAAPAPNVPMPVGVTKGVFTNTRKVEAQKPEGKKEAVKAEVQVIRRVGVNQNQNLEPQIQRYVVQLRPMTRSEIHLVLATCSPAPDQKLAIMAEEDKLLKDVARQVAQAQMGGVRRADGAMPDPRKLIPEAVAKLVNDRLSPDQAARYKAESDAKAEFSRKVALDNIVANLDDELLLSPEQRARLSQALDSNWKPAWHGSLQAHLNGNQMVPNIPTAIVAPILDPIQMRAWDKKQKNMTTYWGNFLMMGNFAIEEPAETPAPPDQPGTKP